MTEEKSVLLLLHEQLASWVLVSQFLILNMTQIQSHPDLIEQEQPFSPSLVSW